MTVAPGQTATTTFAPAGCASASCEITATSTVSAVAVPSPAGSASAAAATTYLYTATSKECSSISCGIWYFGDTQQWYGIPGVKVWKDDINCNNTGGFGYSITVTGCGFNNSPNYPPNPINAYDDIHWAAVVNGFPIDGSHAMNFQDFSNGAYTTAYS